MDFLVLFPSVRSSPQSRQTKSDIDAHAQCVSCQLDVDERRLNGKSVQQGCNRTATAWESFARRKSTSSSAQALFLDQNKSGSGSDWQQRLIQLENGSISSKTPLQRLICSKFTYTLGNRRKRPAARGNFMISCPAPS